MSFPAINSPSKVTMMPPSTAITIEVCTALCTLSMSLRPIALAITTFAPSAMPINRFKIKPIMGLFAPTAATATVLSPAEKLPTTAMSEALNNCSRMAVAATGRAYRGSLFQIEPWSISIFACDVSVSVVLLLIHRTPLLAFVL